MIQSWISIILSSAVVSVITSGIITYIIEKRKYSQEYWKITIDKRLETYEKIEKILIYFQSVHFVNERPCHLAFLNSDSFDKLQTEIATISWKRNWISPLLYKKLIALNRLLNKLDISNQNIESESISEFGVKNYSEIADIRDDIIKILAQDYLNMPKVEKFFKSKIRIKNTTMKKNYIIAVVIGLLVLVAVLTNPNQDRHKEVIKAKLTTYMQKSLKESMSDSENNFGQAIGLVFGGIIIDQIVENLITMDNYVLFSTTKITWEGESKTIGIGAFGNVFVTKQLDDALNEGLLEK